MTIPEKVFDFLQRNSGKSFCDDCIAVECNLKRRQQAERVTAPLSLCTGFIREVAECSKCPSKTKKVIRAL